MKLENAQPYFRIGIPLFMLMTIPLTIWIATTFRDPNIKAYNPLVADLNGDKKIDQDDFLLFQNAYLESNSIADLNQDSRVDSEDFALFAKFYQPKK